MKQNEMIRRKFRAGIVSAAFLAVTAFQAGPVYADETPTGTVTLGTTADNTAEETGETVIGSGIEMYTSYPGIMTKAGETVSYTIDFSSLDEESHIVTLDVKSLPEGWDGYFKGGSSQISSVHVQGETDKDQSSVTYTLTVPAETQEGDYHVELTGTTEDGDVCTLDLTVTVSEVEVGESNFSSEYPQQEGASGTSFKFDTTIVNNRGVDQSYSLSAEAPAGWQVSFVPSGETTAVASINVGADASEGVTVNVTPAQNVEKGDYTIHVTAVSAEDKLTTDLDVSIIGTYAVTLSTPDQRLSFDAYKNQEKKITLTVTNDGNVDLENLNLSSSAATGWEIEFSESTIDVLEAGATKEVTATVKPGDSAIVGDYVAAMVVSNDYATSEADFRVSVKTTTSWGYVAVGIVVVLAAIMALIFRKFGRR